MNTKFDCPLQSLNKYNTKNNENYRTIIEFEEITFQHDYLYYKSVKNYKTLLLNNKIC